MQPAATATCQGCPSAIAASAITATVAPTCRPPSPKSLLRKRQSMPGASSSPTKNSIITTPNSATCWISCVSRPTNPSAGPIIMPASK